MRLRMVSVVPILQRSMPETPLAAWIREFQVKESSFFEKKNLLLFENSELDEAGTNSDSRKFGRGGAIVGQKLRLRKISFQIFWRLVNTSFNLSECVSRPVFETDSNCNAASSCSQNP